MSEALFMIRAELDPFGLARFAGRMGLGHVEDGGYIMHAVLRALFGDLAVRPFVVHEGLRRLVLLGYGASDHHRMAEQAKAAADPLALEAIDLASMCSKTMPSSWRAGAIYRFETRVCPIVRMSGRSIGEEPREVDAFLHRCLQVGRDTPVDRELVYRDWLARELTRNGVAKLLNSRVIRFQRQRLVRRDRSGAESVLRRCERPDATLAGTLEVVVSEAFGSLIRRGLGRHRGFGFGMMLLRH